MSHHFPYPSPPERAPLSRFGEVADAVTNALAEDIGSGDLTSQSFLRHSKPVSACIIAREPCVLAGMECAHKAFKLVDSDITFTNLLVDGTKVQRDQVVLEIAGPVASILTAERVALNFLQRLSAIATLTHRFVEAIAGTSATIVDTRKTTPGLRALEKKAVLAGGGRNHRHGLYDAVMIKDNHLAATGSLAQLQHQIDSLLAERPKVLIEIEADSLDQVRDFVNLKGVSLILLDNMATAQMKQAVALRREGLFFEASGGISLQTARAIAETGVDFLSVGALTHSAGNIDLSLEMI